MYQHGISKSTVVLDNLKINSYFGPLRPLVPPRTKLPDGYFGRTGLFLPWEKLPEAAPWCDNPTYNKYAGRYVSCRECERCVSRSRYKLVQRSMMEIHTHPRTWFVTLTYRKEPSPSRSKRIITKYLKKIKKSHKIRYLCATEYGKQHGRIHHHLLIHGQWTLEQRHLRKSYGFGITEAKLLKDEFVLPNGKQGTKRDAAFYVAKYCCKPGTTGRIRVSNKYGRGIGAKDIHTDPNITGLDAPF